MWCSHKWVETKRTYTPPAYGSHVKHASEYLLQRMMFGLTNITQECSKCGRIEVRNVTGKV